MMNCNPLLIMKTHQDKLKAMFPHASESTLKRNPSFATELAQAWYPGYDVKIPVTVAPVVKSKYRNIKVEYDGMKFDSKHELACWKNLKLREKAGEIQDLVRQVPFVLTSGQSRIGKFTPDFMWKENGRTVIADAKSPATRKEAAYRLRKKLFEALYAPLVIREL